MATSRFHRERHRTDRIGWLRAAVLGANDGIVSTASLVLGVAAASVAPQQVLITGVAGLVAGAMSMAAGEYVSVHSQADTEAADLSRERIELQTDPVAEQRELAGIYVRRGLDPALAQQVATQLMQHDALGDSTAAVGLLQQARELVDSYPSVDLRLQLILASVRIRSPNAPSDYREARSLLQRIGPWRHAFQLHLAAQHLSAPLNAEALTSAVEARQTLLQRMPASMSTHFAEVSQRMLDQPKASP